MPPVLSPVYAPAATTVGNNSKVYRDSDHDRLLVAAM